MMDKIEAYILKNYTSPDFPQSYESFLKENYKDIVPDLILGDETLTDITNKVIKGEEVDDSYLGTFKDYYGETVYEPEVDFTKALAVQARYIDDAEYLEWLNDDKMAKVLAEYPTRADLIDHLGPTIEELGEKYYDDPNLELLINNMTYKSHPLAFYEFSVSNDFSEQDGDFGFRDWIRKGINSIKRIRTQDRNDNLLSSSLDTSDGDQSEVDDKVVENIKDKGLALQTPDKPKNYEIPMGMRQDRNPNHKGDMARRTPTPTRGMIDTATFGDHLKVDRWMENNSRRAFRDAGKHSFKGISDTGSKFKIPGFIKGSAVTLGAVMIAPKVIDYIKKKKLEESDENPKLISNEGYYQPSNFSLADDLVKDIEKSASINPIRPLSNKDKKLIAECIKYLISMYYGSKVIPFFRGDMSLNTKEKVLASAIPASIIGAKVYDKIKTQSTKEKMDRATSELDKIDIYKKSRSEKKIVKPILYTLTGISGLGLLDSGLSRLAEKFRMSPDFSSPKYELSTSLNPNGKMDVCLLDPKTKEVKVRFRNVDFDDDEEDSDQQDEGQDSQDPKPESKDIVPVDKPEVKSEDKQLAPVEEPKVQAPEEIEQPKPQNTESAKSTSSQTTNESARNEIIDVEAEVLRNSVNNSDSETSNEATPKPDRRSNMEKSDEILRQKGWSDEEINKLKSPKFGIFKSKYVKENEAFDKMTRNREVNDAQKLAAGYKDDPEINSSGKKSKGKSSEFYKGFKKLNRTLRMGIAANTLGNGVKALGRGFLAIAAPQTNYNRPSVN